MKLSNRHLLLVLFLLLLVITRFLNLDRTARFIWDESSDLVRIQQIYLERDLTLVGPISEDGNKVFPSLTYYMLLPFAVLGNFHPLSTALGAAFWGALTAVLILILINKINKALLIPSALLVLTWYPLVEIGRWAWNPNLIPFWMSLSLLLYFFKKDKLLFLSGLFIGLSFHHHYLSVFAIFAFWLGVTTDAFMKKNPNRIMLFSLGLSMAFVPFVLFDLTHPPGLFLSRILYFNYLAQPPSSINFLIDNIANVTGQSFNYLIQIGVFRYLFYPSFLFLIFKDIKAKSKALFLLFVFAFQIAGSSLVETFYTHYILPGIIFFLTYLIYPRNKSYTKVATVCLLLVLASSLITIIPQLNKVSWQTDIKTVYCITESIEETITLNELKNNNIAVLASPDENIYGRRYRDLLLLKGIELKNKDEYRISDHLFAVSTSREDVLRKDPAYEMSFFSQGELLYYKEFDN